MTRAEQERMCVTHKGDETGQLTEFTVAEHVANERQSTRSGDLLERLDVRRLNTAQFAWQVGGPHIVIVFFQLEPPEVGQVVDAGGRRVTSQQRPPGDLQ